MSTEAKPTLEVVVTPDGVKEIRIKTSESGELKAITFYVGLMDELRRLGRVARWVWHEMSKKQGER